MHLLALLLATIVNVVVNVSVVCTIAATAAVGVVVPVLFSAADRQDGRETLAVFVVTALDVFVAAAVAAVFSCW